MTTKNIEWLIGRLRAFSGTSLAPALMHQAADTLQSQAERVKALELDLDVQAGSIEAVQAVNMRQAERIKELEGRLDDATAAARTEQMIAETAQAAASRLLTERDTLRAQLAEIEEAEPVLVVEKEPDYWSGGHFHEGSKSHIGSTKVWRLPIGTKLFTRPMPAEIENVEPVIWAISYDGVTPYTLWHEGDGPLLDCEVKRQGGTTQKMPLFTHPMPAQDVTELVELLEFMWREVSMNDYAFEKLETALSKYKGAK